jgi:signal transduction histidine kinase
MPVEIAIQELSQPLLDHQEREVPLRMPEEDGLEQTLAETRAFIAHEMRHAIAPLAAYARLLDQSLAEPEVDRGAAAEKARRIIKLAEGAGQVVNRYLEYSQPFSSRWEKVEIDRMFEQSLNAVRPVCERQNIEIIWQPGAQARVLADRWLLPQVWRHLLLNALEAMSGGGKLIVATRRENQQVIVTISDSGVGIKPEYLDRVFELGFSTKTGQRGAGIGLALARRIVQHAHGGRISIVNNPDNAGVTATVALPVAREEAANGE